METFETHRERGCGLDVHKAKVLSNKYFLASTLTAQSQADPKLSQRLLCGYWYLPGKTFHCTPIDFEKKDNHYYWKDNSDHKSCLCLTFG